MTSKSEVKPNGWLKLLCMMGVKRIVGEMELGKIAPEPTGGSIELGVYRGAHSNLL